MVLIDSPFERCPRCGSYVLLDQSQRACAQEHGCGEGPCPLAEYFEGQDFPPVADGANPKDTNDSK